MDSKGYKLQLAIVLSAIGPRGSSKDFIENGINKAKEVIINLLRESPSVFCH